MSTKFRRFSALHCVLMLMLLVAFLIPSCHKPDEPEVDCTTVTGATFTSNGGQMRALISSKCTNGNCHGNGGDGTEHWTYSDNYNTLKEHFEHMYESAVLEKEMPPSGSPQLTQEEIDRFQCWKEAGFPE